MPQANSATDRIFPRLFLGIRLNLFDCLHFGSVTQLLAWRFFIGPLSFNGTQIFTD